MPITIACPSCCKQYKVGDEKRGKKVKCKCGETFRVPELTPVPVADDLPSGANQPPKRSPLESIGEAKSNPTVPRLLRNSALLQPGTLPQLPDSATGVPFEIVFDQYFRGAVFMFVMAMIGFAVPDLAVNLRMFRKLNPHDVPYMASFAVALAVGCMFYSQRKNCRVAFTLCGGMLAGLAVAWVLTLALRPAGAGGNVGGNDPNVVFGKEEINPLAEHLPRSEPFGGSGGSKYALVDNTLRPVIGFHAELAHGKLARLDPLYDHPAAPGPTDVVAKDGYAVGGIAIEGGGMVEAVSPIFMKLDGRKLNPADNYSTAWLGDRTHGQQNVLASDGRFVLGIFGAKGMFLDSLGLVFDKVGPSGNDFHPAPKVVGGQPDQHLANPPIEQAENKNLMPMVQGFPKFDRPEAPQFDFAFVNPKVADLPRTEMLGGDGGEKYAIVDENLRPVIGFKIPGILERRPTLKELAPLYDRSSAGDQSAVLANDGYGVGGLIICKDNFVERVRIIFMKLAGDRLDPTDRYESDWFGKEVQAAPQTLAGDGQLVLGVYGGKGIILDSIGLILGKPQK